MHKKKMQQSKIYSLQNALQEEYRGYGYKIISKQIGGRSKKMREKRLTKSRKSKRRKTFRKKGFFF
jgi:hypothetical protein